jgi:hypothetical protein
MSREVLVYSITNHPCRRDFLVRGKVLHLTVMVCGQGDRKPRAALGGSRRHCDRFVFGHVHHRGAWYTRRRTAVRGVDLIASGSGLPRADLFVRGPQIPLLRAVFLNPCLSNEMRCPHNQRCIRIGLRLRDRWLEACRRVERHVVVLGDHASQQARSGLIADLPTLDERLFDHRHRATSPGGWAGSPSLCWRRCPPARTRRRSERQPGTFRRARGSATHPSQDRRRQECCEHRRFRPQDLPRHVCGRNRSVMTA